MSKETGGPAFQGWEINNGVITVTSQMTLRDYFAAKAMPIIPAQAAHNMKPNESGADYCARRSYEWADAMLKERNK